MATDVEFDIIARDKGASKNFNKVDRAMTEADKSAKKVTGSMGSMFKSMLGAQSAFSLIQNGFRAITTSIKDSIKISVDAEETFSKFGTVFSGVLPEANKALKNLQDNFGLSKVKASDMLSATGDLLVGMGATEDAALTLSEKTQKLAVDLASFTNYSGGAKGASEALTKAMLGEREMLKSLGIVITENMMKAELKRRGQDKLTGAALLQAKAENTLAIAMRQSGKAIGDYARTADSTANRMRQLENAYEDFQVSLGKSITESNAFDDVLNAVQKTLKDPKFIAAVTDAIDIVISLFKALFKIGEKAVQMIGEVYNEMVRNNPTIQKILDGWMNLLLAFDDRLSQTYDKMDIASKRAHDLAKKQIDKFRLFKMFTSITHKEMQILLKDFQHVENAGAKYNMIMRALAQGKYDKKFFRPVSFSAQTFLKGQKLLNAELHKTKTALDTNAESASNVVKLTDAHIKAISKLNDSLGVGKSRHAELNDEVVALNVVYGKQRNLIDDIKERIQKLITNTEYRDQIDELIKSVDKFLPLALDMIGALSNIGIISEQAADGLFAVVDGIDTIKIGAKGFKEAGKEANSFIGIVGKLSSAFTMLSGAVGIVQGLLKAIAGPSGELEAARRRMEGLQMNTAGWGARIEELAQQLGGADSAGRAFNALLAEMIRDSDINRKNFDTYIAKVREIVSAYEDGNATIEETQKNYGSAFSAILEVAQGLGLEGGRSMTDLVKLADEFGLEIKEIDEYIRKNMISAVDGWRAAMETFGGYSIPVLDNMMRLQDMIADNQPLIDSIRGAQQAIEGMAYAGEFAREGLDEFGRSAEQDFREFEQIALDAMQELKDAGFSTADALKADTGMAGILQQLIFLSKEYGFKIDDNVKALIDMGINSGAISEDMRTDNERIVDAVGQVVNKLDEMIFALTGKMPGAIETMVDGFTRGADRMRDKAGEVANAYENIADTIYNDVMPSISDMGSKHTDIMEGHSIIPEIDRWYDKLDVIKDQMAVNVKSAMAAMGMGYDEVAAKIQAKNDMLSLQIEGIESNIKTMVDQAGLMGLAGMGNKELEKFGIFSKERKTEMSEEFVKLASLWETRRDEFSQSGIRALVSALESLTVLPQYEQGLSGYIESLKKYFVKSEFQHGTPPGGFLVPSGYPNDSFTAGFSSGERIHVTPASGNITNNNSINMTVEIFASPGGDSVGSLMDKFVYGIENNVNNSRERSKRALNG